MKIHVEVTVGLYVESLFALTCQGSDQVRAHFEEFHRVVNFVVTVVCGVHFLIATSLTCGAWDRRMTASKIVATCKSQNIS